MKKKLSKPKYYIGKDDEEIAPGLHVYSLRSIPWTRYATYGDLEEAAALPASILTQPAISSAPSKEKWLDNGGGFSGMRILLPAYEGAKASGMDDTDAIAYAKRVATEVDQNAFNRWFPKSEMVNGVAYPGHGALEQVSPEFDLLILSPVFKLAGKYAINKFLNSDLRYELDPRWMRVYHKSDKPFDIEHFYTGTTDDSGLHVAKSLKNNGVSGDYVYKGYIKKPSFRFLDTHKNGAEMFDTEFGKQFTNMNWIDATDHPFDRSIYDKIFGKDGYVLLNPYGTQLLIVPKSGQFFLLPKTTVNLIEETLPKASQELKDRLAELYRSSLYINRNHFGVPIGELAKQAAIDINTAVSDALAKEGYDVGVYANHVSAEMTGDSYSVFNNNAARNWKLIRPNPINTENIAYDLSSERLKMLEEGLDEMNFETAAKTLKLPTTMTEEELLAKNIQDAKDFALKKYGSTDYANRIRLAQNWQKEVNAKQGKLADKDITDYSADEILAAMTRAARGGALVNSELKDMVSLGESVKGKERFGEEPMTIRVARGNGYLETGNTAEITQHEFRHTMTRNATGDSKVTIPEDDIYNSAVNYNKSILEKTDMNTAKARAKAAKIDHSTHYLEYKGTEEEISAADDAVSRLADDANMTFEEFVHKNISVQEDGSMKYAKNCPRQLKVLSIWHKDLSAMLRYHNRFLAPAAAITTATTLKQPTGKK